MKMVYNPWQNKHWWKEGNLVERTLFISKERGFPGGSDSKESACITEDSGLILGSRRSPGQGIGYPFQSSCLENSMDRSLAGYSPWGHKESDTTETSLHFIYVWLCGTPPPHDPTWPQGTSLVSSTLSLLGLVLHRWGDEGYSCVPPLLLQGFTP